MGNKLQTLLATLAVVVTMQCVAARPCMAAEPIRLIVGFPAGGTLDVLSREFAARLSNTLDRSVIVMNRPGASGAIAATYVAQSPANGDTLLIAPITFFTLYPLTTPDSHVDLKDFTPIAGLASFQYVLGISGKVPARTVSEYADLVKKSPKWAQFGTPGVAAAPQFYGLSFAKQLKLTMMPIPYSGTAPIVTNLQGGQISAAVLPLNEFAKLNSSGATRVLAITGKSRQPDFPDVPTFNELGVAVNEDGQYALFARAGTPASVTNKLAAASQAALKDPTLKTQFGKMFMQPMGQTGQDLSALIDDSSALWVKAVKSAAVK